MQATLCLAVLTTRELEERKDVVLRPTFLERPRWYLADFLVVALVVALVADLAPLATVSATVAAIVTVAVAVAVAVVIAVIMSEPFHHETELVLAMSSTSTTSPNHTARLYRNPIWHNNSLKQQPGRRSMPIAYRYTTQAPHQYKSRRNAKAEGRVRSILCRVPLSCAEVSRAEGLTQTFYRTGTRPAG